MLDMQAGNRQNKHPDKSSVKEKEMATITIPLQSSSMIAKLGELVNSIEQPFSCGGALPEIKTIDLIYKKPSGDWSPKPLLLPDDLAEERFQDFLSSCSTASFGIGGEAVTDKTYRDALKLEPEFFHSSFEIASTSLLSNISQVLRLDLPIQAELYMLNIYSTGGHFKTHVDTPRSKEMFGSLVVCLPSEFTGGALLTRHQGRQVTFDWSSSTCAHWAAFFSDVEHQVLPVTSGYRITLTYNLSYLSFTENAPETSWANIVSGLSPGIAVDKEKLIADLELCGKPRCFKNYSEQHQNFICRGCEIEPAILKAGVAHAFSDNLDVTISPLYKDFLVALQNPEFMKDGGTLGFYCQHKYTDLSTNLAKFSPYLKGGDAIVYKTAKSLHLPISLKPILCRQEYTVSMEEEEESESDEESYILPGFMPHQVDRQGYGEHVCNDVDSWEDYIKSEFPDIEKVKGIVWCQRPEQKQPLRTTLCYGNCPELDLYYQAAAFLIRVPPAAERKY